MATTTLTPEQALELTVGQRVMLRRATKSRAVLYVVDHKPWREPDTGYVLVPVAFVKIDEPGAETLSKHPHLAIIGGSASDQIELEAPAEQPAAAITSTRADAGHIFYRATVQGAADSDSAIASALEAIGFNASRSIVVHSSSRTTKSGARSVRLTIVTPEAPAGEPEPEQVCDECGHVGGHLWAPALERLGATELATRVYREATCWAENVCVACAPALYAELAGLMGEHLGACPTCGTVLIEGGNPDCATCAAEPGLAL